MFQKIVAGIFSIILVVLGVGLLFFAVTNLQQGNAARFWPTTTGIIKTAEVYKGVSGTGNKRRIRRCLKLVYDYKVDGQSLSGDRITLGAQACHHNQQAALKEANDFKAGTQVSVIYNPEKPFIAALRVADDGNVGF